VKFRDGGGRVALSEFFHPCHQGKKGRTFVRRRFSTEKNSHDNDTVARLLSRGHKHAGMPLFLYPLVIALSPPAKTKRKITRNKQIDRLAKNAVEQGAKLNFNRILNHTRNWTEFPSGNLIHFLYSSRRFLSRMRAADKIHHLGTYLRNRRVRRQFRARSAR
jgi:hypothetical protein